MYHQSYNSGLTGKKIAATYSLEEKAFICRGTRQEVARAEKLIKQLRDLEKSGQNESNQTKRDQRDDKASTVTANGNHLATMLHTYLLMDTATV
jgi:hypothetical protein